ncbi:hypothetical protein ACERJO_14025 [Halalkalibacter sp. AB-rgal2]|uniref:hypothetical protein n=1 Tax=Halalkalibacter sp. AB-rgal2 TaxID=3242695 RepID=UPI00359D8411
MGIVSLIFTLMFYGLIIYFLITVLRHLRAKNHNDLLMLKKLDHISKKLEEMSNREYRS